MVRVSGRENLKFLCSYGGRILPRSTDGKLRYVGGLTRVLAVDRSISFSDLMAKLADFCGYSVKLKCALPNGDLETLVSVKSDEDLRNVIEEYDRAGSGRQIRAILSPVLSAKHASPPSSVDVSPRSPFSVFASPPMQGRLYSGSCTPQPWFHFGARGYSGKSSCHNGCYSHMHPRALNHGLQSRNYWY